MIDQAHQPSATLSINNSVYLINNYVGAPGAQKNTVLSLFGALCSVSALDSISDVLVF